jgi:hypothetical protein
MTEVNHAPNNPVTAADALKLWDAGEIVPAFQVEAKPERQTIVWAAAFDLLRSDLDPESEGHDLSHLSDREREVAQSIAHVAKEKGWARMVSAHTHANSPAIAVTKPKDGNEDETKS